MKIVEYNASDNQSHWLQAISRCDWRSGKYLGDLLHENRFYEKLGKGAKLLLLTEGEELIAFASLSEKKYDIISDLSPWVGFVYTFPQHRGHRYYGVLLRYAETLAGSYGYPYLYLSTNHTGLYERLGWEPYARLTDWRNEEQQVYRKQLD